MWIQIRRRGYRSESGYRSETKYRSELYILKDTLIIDSLRNWKINQ